MKYYYLFGKAALEFLNTNVAGVLTSTDDYELYVHDTDKDPSGVNLVSKAVNHKDYGLLSYEEYKILHSPISCIIIDPIISGKIKYYSLKAVIDNTLYTIANLNSKEDAKDLKLEIEETYEEMQGVYINDTSMLLLSDIINVKTVFYGMHEDEVVQYEFKWAKTEDDKRIYYVCRYGTDDMELWYDNELNAHFSLDPDNFN